jgi:hypothetical protein
MYSNFIKLLVTITGFSPVLFTYWLIITYQNCKNLKLYFQFDSLSNIWVGAQNLFVHHYLLLFFLLIILLSNFLLKKALATLTIGSIEVKSIKPADINFTPILFSYLLPLSKLYFTTDKEQVFIIIAILIYAIYVFIGKSSYHYNLVFRLFFGYKNYEIQSKKEMTYLLLSKTKLVNTKQVTEYIQLTEYMIINVTKA